MIRKPTLDSAMERELEAIGPPELRRLLAAAVQHPEGSMDHFLEPDPAPRLPRGYVDRATAMAWLAWRDAADRRRDTLRFWILAVLGIVAAVAGVVAAFEGWHW